MNGYELRRKMRAGWARASATLGFYTHGSLLCCDIRQRLKNESVGVIFDVGANIGQSVEELQTDYPGAAIYAFEPDPDTFLRLRANLSQARKIQTLNFALGSERRSVRFDNSHRRSVMHQIARDQGDERFPVVAVETIDQFCADNGISSIDYLKIDTEGHDLEVLRGAGRMLAESRINILIAECSMNSDNQRHVQFGQIHSSMEIHGYRLFGIYDQVTETPTGKPNLRRANVAYVSPGVLARNSNGNGRP